MVKVSTEFINSFINKYRVNNKITSLIIFLLLLSFTTIAQVPVREEPRHKKVLQNKYIRLLNVWIPPADTSLFHIHSTPSLFLHFTDRNIASQIKGKDWVAEKTMAGKSWYRSFVNDTLVHRVANIDSLPFHVTDIEILSAYKPTAQLKPLPFTVLFDNEKAGAYQLTTASFNKNIITGRGPMIAELVAGKEVLYYDARRKKLTPIKTGNYQYIKPGSSFYFSANDEVNLVLFEIK